MPEQQLSTSTLGPFRPTRTRKSVPSSDEVVVDLREMFSHCKWPHQALIGELKAYLEASYSGRLLSVGHKVSAASHPDYEVLLLRFTLGASSCDIIAELKAKAFALHDERCTSSSTQ